MGSSVVNINRPLVVFDVVSHLNLETGLYGETLNFFEIDFHIELFLKVRVICVICSILDSESDPELRFMTAIGNGFCSS